MTPSLLNGIRVLEVGHAVAGPAASQILRDYGADVIKIERPKTGDIFRNVPGMGPTMFLSVNRGKKSVVLDLKAREGLKIFYDLSKSCDVVLENLGPNIAENLGVTYQRIRRANPSVVYCKLESFGSGPYKNVPAFDPVLQAATGIMSTTGFPPDKYVRTGVSIIDMTAGMQAAIAILSALIGRNESKNKRGAEIHISLYDSACYFMSYWIALYELEKKDTFPLGSAHIFGAPYNLFKTRDGYIYIAIANDSAWRSFCNSLSFQDLLSDLKFSTSEQRVQRKAELERKLSRRLELLNTAQIEKKLFRSGVPFGRFNTVKSLLADRQFLESGVLQRFFYDGKEFRETVNPSIVNGTRPYAKKSPPTLGSDTENVLRTVLQMDDAQIGKLRAKGIIG